MTTSLLKELRIEYHKKLCRDIFGLRDGTTVYSNADSTSPASVDLAQGMAEIIGQPICANPPTGQKAGSLFTHYTKEFLDDSFKRGFRSDRQNLLWLLSPNLRPLLIRYLGQIESEIHNQKDYFRANPVPPPGI